jgi:hypothetical protein
MPRCASDGCYRRCPSWLVRRGVGTTIVDAASPAIEDGSPSWFCSRRCVERMAHRRLVDLPASAEGIRALAPMRLGAILRHQGACSADQIEEALRSQRASRLKLGAELRAMGAIDKAMLLRALAAQAGVGYLTSVDPATVREAPGALSPHVVRALGLVPFSEPAASRIKVATAAAVPRAAIGALRRLTGWIPDAYLVADEDFRTLLDAYGTGVPESARASRATFMRAEDAPRAAALIAAAAAAQRASTIREVRWDPYTWVRVQSEGLVSDVLVAPSTNPDFEEVPCQAVST